MQNDGTDIEKLLEQRAEIDRRLFEQHARRLAVLFTDIVGSTDYFERKGDIEGLSLVHRHNQLLFPVVESHGGRVVKTIGDAILAVFEDPLEAVSAAVEMQEVLVEERSRPGGMPIRIRIGIHLGTALLAGGDVFGDAVNTAARVVSQAGGGDVLVSEVLAREVAGSFTLTERGSFQPKGKSTRLRLYAVRWSGSTEAQASRSQDSAAIPAGLVLELGPGPRGMRVLLRQQGIRETTVRRFIDVEVTPERLAELTARFKAFMD
ncbi:MAG: adenylate/guanylate cyclase domain-containing protein, partial [Deltaproteobacteria bacterium]